MAVLIYRGIKSCYVGAGPPANNMKINESVNIAYRNIAWK
jgi:hypothetical protein